MEAPVYEPSWKHGLATGDKYTTYRPLYKV